jgi:dephospho-CoA kinase
MIVIGLTGSIAMGKSETVKMFAAEGVPVCDSDTIVHRLYDEGGALVAAVAKAFPEAMAGGRVDRTRLAAMLSRQPERFAELEAIVHPLVKEELERFLDRCRKDGARIAVLDIPLLFESGRQRDVDRILVVSAPAHMQKARALSRPGMTEKKLAQLLARQWPDEEKRRRADFIVDSSQGLDHARRQVRDIVARLKSESEEPHA